MTHYSMSIYSVYKRVKPVFTRRREFDETGLVDGGIAAVYIRRVDKKHAFM